MTKYNWYTGKIINIIDETPAVKRFFIEISELKKFDFEPGQFVILDPEKKYNLPSREYSIASSPEAGNVIELIIVLNESGKLTPFLFNEIRIGSNIQVSSALGKFLLPEKIERDLCFICTGVGIAPLRSMYLYILKNNITHKKINLIFGTRKIVDMCYAGELEQLEKEFFSFHFHPVLSREKSPGWNGRNGYVHQVYKELYSDLRPAYFYICGWKNMILEARDNLLRMGYQRSDIKFELYDK